MKKYLTSRDEKYKLEIEIFEELNLPKDLSIYRDPIIDIFYTSASFFPIINLSYEKDHIELLKKNKLSISLTHSGKFTPVVDTISGKVKFHVNYLKYLWSLCYSLFYYSHKIIDLEYRQEWNGSVLSLDKIDEIFFMFEFSKILKNSNLFTSWHIEMPYPSPKYVITNNIFHIVIAFIYYHELSHLLLNHEPVQDKFIKFEQEKEADNNALSIIFDNYKDSQKKIIGIGVFIAIASNLFLLEQKYFDMFNNHHDTDQRLFNAVSYITLNDKADALYLKRFVTLITEFYLKNINIELPQKRYYSTNQLYEDIFNIFDTLKNNKQ